MHESPIFPGSEPSPGWIIVPGARVTPEGLPSPALEDRLRCALEVWREDAAQRILVSGDARSRWGDETAAMWRWLVTHGVPESAVVIDPEGVRTLATLVRARSVFGIREAWVCSQSYHLPRIRFLARATGLSVRTAVARGHPVPLRDRLRELLAWTRAVLDVLMGRSRSMPH